MASCDRTTRGALLGDRSRPTGFARSDKPYTDYTPIFYVRSVLSLLDVLQVERAVFVGHSLGALIAQRLMLARPQRVQALTLIAGGLPIVRRTPPQALFTFLTPGLGEYAYNSLRRSQDAAYETLRPFYFDLDALPDVERAFLRERVWERVWNEGQQRAFLSTLRWMAVEQALRADEHARRLATAATPTTIIWGPTTISPHLASGIALAQHLPAAALHTIARCGHNPQHERPAELLALLYQGVLLGPLPRTSLVHRGRSLLFSAAFGKGVGASARRIGSPSALKRQATQCVLSICASYRCRLRGRRNDRAAPQCAHL
ncbi:alpha/beta hydrolase [Candidatus Gracilibacteria bacterium]|nr:alpha/beta hydrolase [Candidatus Gracilibacteria bacterium]